MNRQNAPFDKIKCIDVLIPNAGIGSITAIYQIIVIVSVVSAKAFEIKVGQGFVNISPPSNPPLADTPFICYNNSAQKAAQKGRIS